MPAKKATGKGAGAEETNKKKETNARSSAKQEAQDVNKTKTPDTTNGSSKKRKAQDAAAKGPSKASRKSPRGASSAPADPVKLINYLLSANSLALCRPKDENIDTETRDKDICTYSTSTFNPFEELVCALILSRPIGHMLGLRSIRTLFNEPHNLTDPKTIRTAGKDGCRQALDQARTQHRQKTAEELVLLADAVMEHLGHGENDTSLERVRKECGHDVEKEREMIKKHVKGMGKTGIDIFARRIQGVWKEWYPFADERTSKALRELGLDDDAEALAETIEKQWGKIKKGDIDGKGNEEMRRKVFVRILERTIGADLEGNIDKLRDAVA